MKEIHYDFVDLDSKESFELLGNTLNGTVKDKSLIFNNEIVKGELIKATPDVGLWIRKWRLTTLKKITLHKHKAPLESDVKFILIYFLNPSIFSLKHRDKQLNINAPCNNIFLSSTLDMDFSVIPNQPFYVLDIAFTVAWLVEQFKDADECINKRIAELVNTNSHKIIRESCSNEEYKLLNELDLIMTSGNEDSLFIRSRVYNLIVLFFDKMFNCSGTRTIKNKINYEQVMQVHRIIEENLTGLPKLDVIAKEVNLSVSSLGRQFSKVYGKGIYEYYVEKRMELAKKVILENGVSIKDIAERLGYKQASHFIETFTKYHGYSPGTLKVING